MAKRQPQESPDLEAQKPPEKRGRAASRVTDLDFNPHVPEKVPKEDYKLCIHELFKRQALKTPDATALEAAGNAQCTYKELDEWSDKLAAKLRVQYGARPQTLVGIYMERCIEYAIAYLGALKTGGAYCPVEIAYPPGMLESIFEEITFVAVLTKGPLQDKLPKSVPLVLMDEGWIFALGEYDTDVLKEDKADLESRCYVIFSGGTTGKPKAIEAPHRSPTHSYLWRLTLSGYGPGARVACNVFFVWEVLRPLLRGGCAIIVPDDVIFDSKAVVDFMQAHRVTEMLFTPSLLETILTAIDGDPSLSLKGVVETLRVVYMNGEVITVKLLNQARRLLPGVRLLSTYSISECGEVGGVDLAEHRADICPKFCPAGHLASHCKVLLLDEAGEEATEVGEVLIAGPGVGTGYIGLEKLTKERFVMLKGERYYRTGDRARFLAGGLIEIIGRCDYMVKVRGYSIVLPAVETAILKRLAVASCVVVTSGEEGTDKRIVAYVVVEKDDCIGGRFAGWKLDPYGCCPELFRVLSQDLPHYAVPHTWVEIPELKMNMSSGKADRKALPAPPVPPPKTSLPEGFRLPVDSHTNELEQAICAIFEEVLGSMQGSLHTECNFFELGGHSLSASRLLARVRACGGGDVAMANFLRHPTPRALASLVADPVKAAQVDSAEQIKARLEQEVELYKLKESGMNLGVGKQFWGGRGICHWRGMGPQLVLLTGASGFLGAFLLRDLLLNTTHAVVCVIRATGAEEARKRAVANLKNYGITSEAFENLLATRVNFVAGDLEQDRLGLPAEQYDYLTMTVDSVVHAAAIVNLSLGYAQLVKANVQGTQNILEFATVNRTKSVSYVSSNAVYPDHGKRLSVDEVTVPEPGVLDCGYSQTKWVCERLVSEAHKRGLPCAVYRLGNLSGPVGAGPHKDGAWNPSDSNLILLEACMRIGSVPSRLSLRMEATPVDYVSQFIVAAIKNRDVAESHANGKTFNLIGSHPVPLSLLPSLLGSDTEPLSQLPLEAWLEKHHKNPPKRGLPFTETSLVGLCGTSHNYAQENVEAFSKAAGLPAYPGVNAETLRTYTLKLIEVGTLTRPPPQPQQAVAEFAQRLRGRIAVVTGASSGMGEGIAEALAKEGAAVALFARRADVIDQVQMRIEKMGGLALAVPVDVSDRKAVQAAFARVQRDLGEVDILINAAGCMYFTLMRNEHFQEWENMIDTNCKGVVNCAGSVIKSMMRRGTGHILNISSDAARTTFPALSVYCASKAFVTAFSKAIRSECVGTGVRVTDIQPGDVATNLIKANTDKEAGAKVGVEIGETVGKGADRASVLDVADICRAILFAVTSPAHVGIHEMLIEPRDQMFGDPTSLNSA